MNKPLLIILFLITSSLYGQQTIKNLQWLNVNRKITESSIGKNITLYAQTENIDDDEPVKITIWSKGDESDDFVGEYHSSVKYNQIVFNWVLAFELKEMENSKKEIEENGFTIPQYYFVIQYNTIKSENSNLLAVKDSIKRQIVFEGTKIPARNAEFTLILPGISIIEGKTDSEGYIYVDNLLIGTYYFYLNDEDEGEYASEEDDNDENEDISEEEHEIIPPYQEPDKPFYYKIKEKDSLWKIASYDFIYGNPYLWKKLYEANKSNLINDKNPNLIETGQVLIIPPLGNETREGTR